MTTNFWATWPCWTRCPYYFFFLKIPQNLIFPHFFSFFLVLSRVFSCFLIFSHVFSFFPFCLILYFFKKPTWSRTHLIQGSTLHLVNKANKPEAKKTTIQKPKAKSQKPKTNQPKARRQNQNPEARSQTARSQTPGKQKKPKKTNQPKQPSRNEHTGDFQCRQATHSSHCSSAGKPDTVEVQVPESQTLYRCRKARHCQKPLVPVPESQTLWKYSCRKARHSTSAGKPDTSALPQCRNRQTKGQHSLSTWQDAFLITFVSGVGGRGEAP